jgi:hypothetical protein
MSQPAQASSVSQHTRSKSSGIVCVYCKKNDADFYKHSPHILLSCRLCKRDACHACMKNKWAHKAGCCVLCMRKLAGLKESDGIQDDALIQSLPCPHINQATYCGCTVWRCFDCGKGGLYACEHTMSEPNFMGTRVCLKCGLAYT